MKFFFASWWKRYFDASYYELYQQMIPEKRTHLQVDFIVKQLHLPTGATVLDLGCGYGRLAVPLAKKGYRMICLDFSRALLSIARRTADEQDVPLQCERGDMRSFRLPEQCDAVICMYSSFGYFLRESDHQRTIESIARVLKTNGLFLLDLRTFAGVEKSMSEAGNTPYPEEHAFDRRTQRWIMKRVVAGKKQISSVRIFSLEEVQHLLEDAGMKIMAVFGDYSGSEYERASTRMVVLAQKKS